jgi:hypothetical protein
VVATLDQDPAASEELVRSIIRDLQSGPTFLHYAIDCLPQAEFPKMTQVALDALSANAGNEGAQDFIAHASLQSPQTLHPHLDRIFSLQPNWATYYAQWPWRESGDLHLPFLKGIVEEKTGEAEIRKFPAGPRNVVTKQSPTC